MTLSATGGPFIEVASMKSSDLDNDAFDKLYQRAAERKGGIKQLNTLLPAQENQAALLALSDDRYLAALTKKVFQSGFVWRVVEQKWPDFEEVFFGFDIEKVLMMPDDMQERKAQDQRIIRNFNKVKTIRHNALMLNELAEQHGTRGRVCFAPALHRAT